MKPTLYVLCGPPACGKSTYATTFNAVVVSSDEVRKELFGDASIQKDLDRVFEIVNQRVEKALALGHDVVYDATNIRSYTHKNIIQRFDARFVAVWFDVSKDECLERNAKRSRQVPEKVIARMFRQFEIPTYEEGFSAIIKIST